MFFRLTLSTFAWVLAIQVSASTAGTLSPRQVMQRFDSLLNVGSAGADSQAKALCAGTALRTFSFLAEAEHKLAPFLDSSQSRDTVVEEKRQSEWTGLKIVSDAVFRKPLMGMERMHSVQAVYLFHRTDGWKVAEFEELPDEKTPLTLREDAIALPEDTASHSFFPVSRLAPEDNGVTRMRLRVSLGNGDSLPDLPQGPGQKVLKRGRDWALIETSLSEIPPISPAMSSAGADSLRDPSTQPGLSE